MVGVRKEPKGKRSRLIVKAQGETLEEILSYLRDSAQDLISLTPDLSGEFFLEVGDTALDEEQIEIMIRRLREWGLHPIGIKGSNPITKISAANMGLKVISTSLINSSRVSSPKEENTKTAQEGSSKPRMTENSALQESKILDFLSSDRKVEVHRKTLRGGTRIEVDGNVILIGNVNPGAEIRATGSIVVLGTLRGVVHAGADGDERAFVYASRFQAPAVRIADKHVRIDKDIAIDCCLITIDSGMVKLTSVLK